jgi:hypothetical protein
MSYTDEQTEKIIANLNLGDGSEEDVLGKLRAMPEEEQMKVWAEAMSKSNIDMFDIVLNKVEEKRHLPLARIRDTANRLFVNFTCNGCGMGAEHPSQFLQCTRCKAVRYCNKSCQIRDWKGKGIGATRPRSHKEMCVELAQAKQEFADDDSKGEALRTGLFSSWADQHHESGAFFGHEYLARRGLLGQSKVGFWASPNQTGPYTTALDSSNGGFINGNMLLGRSYPSLKVGWKNLKDDEFPSGPSESPPPAKGITTWEEYMRYIESFRRLALLRCYSRMCSLSIK